MLFRWWERWSALLGAVTVVCWFVAFSIAGGNPSTDDSDAKIVSWYTSHSHQLKQIVGFFIFIAGVLCLFGFLSALRTRLLAAEGQPGRLSTLAFGSGVASAVLWTVAISLFTAPAFTANDTSASNVVPSTFRMFSDFGYQIWVAAVIVAAVTVWAASALAIRTGVLPRWFGWIGVVAGILQLFAIFFIPAFIFWGWILITAALLTVRPSPAPSAPASSAA